MNSLEVNGVEDRGEKHSHRQKLDQNASAEYEGNYVIQHSMLAQSRKDSNSMPPLSGLNQAAQMIGHSAVAKAKRVWIPYNKKQKAMNGKLNSMGSGYNPLLNSQ